MVIFYVFVRGIAVLCNQEPSRRRSLVGEIECLNGCGDMDGRSCVFVYTESSIVLESIEWSWGIN